MKVRLLTFGILILTSTATLANEESFPVCMVDKTSGSLNPDFFNDFSKVSMKLGVCDTTMDPRMKAFLYIQNLRDFTKHLPNKISDEVSDSINVRQDEMIKDLDIKSKVRVPKNSDRLIIKGVFVGMIALPGGRFVSELAKASMDGAFNKQIETVKPGKPIISNLEDQHKQVVRVRDQINASFEVMHDKLTRILESINNPQGVTAKNLKVEEKEYLRSVICSFMPAMPKEISADREDYLTFCSSEHGGGNFNRKRGTSFCSDIESISENHREREGQSIKSAVARSIAENVVMPDPYKLEPNGTTARIEIKVTDFRGNDNKKTITMGYRSSGGMQQLCSILKAPEYRKYWRTKNGRRKLSPVMPVVSLKLPMSVDWRSGNEKHPNSETFNVNKDGDITSLRINDKKTIKANSPAYEKYFSEKKTQAKFLPVRDLIGDKCDE